LKKELIFYSLKNPMKVTDINTQTLTALLSYREKEILLAKVAEVEKEIAALASGEIQVTTRILRAKSIKKRRGVAKGPKNPRSPKGFMQEQIIKLLTEAGAVGASVKELATKVEKPSSQVHVWFGATGKKLGQFEKLESGNWRIATRLLKEHLR
jgi:hypothetical protein